SLVPRRPPSPLFPYTTLFRSPLALDFCLGSGSGRGFRLLLSLCFSRQATCLLALLTHEPGPERALGFELIVRPTQEAQAVHARLDRKSTRLNSSHLGISYAVF